MRNIIELNDASVQMICRQSRCNVSNPRGRRPPIRNPLEQPGTLTPGEFARRARNAPVKLFITARDATAALTEDILKVEREIDERVAGLYGLDQ